MKNRKTTMEKSPKEVILSGKIIDLDMENATLVFDGNSDLEIRNCHFSNPQFIFEGAAGTTIQFLRALIENDSDGTLTDRIKEAIGLKE